MLEAIPWEDIITKYGPLGLGWPAFFYVLAKLIAAQKDAHRVSEAVHRVIEDNTKATTRFSTLLDERLPRRGGGV